MALMAFSLIKDSSNRFNKGSNSSDALALARSGSVLSLCQNNNNVRWVSQYDNGIASSRLITLKSSKPEFRASSSEESAA